MQGTLDFLKSLPWLALKPVAKNYQIIVIFLSLYLNTSIGCQNRSCDESLSKVYSVVYFSFRTFFSPTLQKTSLKAVQNDRSTKKREKLFLY